MAHFEQMQFVLSIRNRFPQSFMEKCVLEIGSLDINGSVRHLFTNCQYLGIDLGPGPGVDQVIHAGDIEGHELYDTIISCEALEHDRFCLRTLTKVSILLRPKGLLIITVMHVGGI